MKSTLIIFGNITFDHFTKEELSLFETKAERKALVHSIEREVEVYNELEMNRVIDENEKKHDSYLMPTCFNGEIVFELLNKLDNDK